MESQPLEYAKPSAEASVPFARIALLSALANCAGFYFVASHIVVNGTYGGIDGLNGFGAIGITLCSLLDIVAVLVCGVAMIAETPRRRWQLLLLLPLLAWPTLGLFTLGDTGPFPALR